MTKFYRVKKDNFLWKEGAILRFDTKKGSNCGGYNAIEDIWNATPALGDEYISATIIECPTNADFFERVYPDSITGKLYKTKDQLVELYKTAFTQ